MAVDCAASYNETRWRTGTRFTGTATTTRGKIRSSGQEVCTDETPTFLARRGGDHLAGGYSARPRRRHGLARRRRQYRRANGQGRARNDFEGTGRGRREGWR